MADEEAVLTDVAPFARGQLTTLRGELQGGLSSTSHEATQLHYRDAMVRIDATLDP